jgi:transcriptional regulator with XRE-family HTH domain
VREFGQLGKFLKEARAESGLTQMEVGKKLGVHVQMVSNWERGLCAPPTHSFQKLIQLLDLNRQEMVEVMLMDSKLSIRAKIYKK